MRLCSATLLVFALLAPPAAAGDRSELAASNDAARSASDNRLPEIPVAGATLTGRWRFDSGSTVEISEYIGGADGVFEEEAGEPADGRGQPFIGLYLDPSPLVVNGGAKPGMFSMVGFRRGSAIEGKLWLFLTRTKTCYPEGQARDFTGELSDDGRTMVLYFESVFMSIGNCAVGKRQQQALTAIRMSKR